MKHLRAGEILFITCVSPAGFTSMTEMTEIADMETIPGESNNQLALTTPEAQPIKRRKKKSMVWEYFTIENVSAGCRRAYCKRCKQSFAYSTGSKVAGTSHLKRHIAKGTCRALLRGQGQDNNQFITPYNPKMGGTRTMSSMAKDVLGAGQEIIKKIRDSVKYVKMSESHDDKFIQVKNQLQVPSEKSLFLDNQTRWNTTYQMLAAASELKEVFDCLDTYDPDYKLAPSMEDWKLAETLCSFLKPLFDAASILTTTTLPTALRGKGKVPTPLCCTWLVLIDSL
ncbi:Putative AC transposase [Gossypium arboreum]|uniref:Putative AC transposase n=1 Tax=Gossypium arboreum TaxID=29729 RepID=A0A0B0MTJ0_GOSAR|nr:Putative AC transposase [Gossypium arboreum]KHG03692.1 Putative AC transposase [Gossypium arboreum]KHG06906.1 Putative AC transposase [Gossypium arboreum]KHG21679.1 Putative AC transposase [Gossypium arboreum]